MPQRRLPTQQHNNAQATERSDHNIRPLSDSAGRLTIALNATQSFGFMLLPKRST
jgi:hypothetical protein